MSYFNQESARLSYRKLTENDIPDWTTFFENNDRLDYLGIDLSKPYDELAAEWIMMQFPKYEKTGLGHLAVILKETGAFIGMCGVHLRDVNGQKEYEIAYSLLPDYWKKGYGTEMARQMTVYARDNINFDRFVSIIDKRNVDSIHVATKNGMTVLYSTHYLGMDVDVYGINKSNIND